MVFNCSSINLRFDVKKIYLTTLSTLLFNFRNRVIVVVSVSQTQCKTGAHSVLCRVI